MRRTTHSTARPPRAALAGAALLAALAASACGGGEKRDSDPAATPPAAATTPPAPTLNDAQIAHVAVTANAIDSAAGADARTKARDTAVKDFARQMVQDHGAVNKQAVALAQRLNVTPEDNDVSRQLQQGAEQARTGMQSATGADFDRAYIDREVQYHQAVLDALDKTLIPGAQNADLKALLQQVRPNIDAHLQRAKQIQGRLSSSPAAGTKT